MKTPVSDSLSGRRQPEKMGWRVYLFITAMRFVFRVFFRFRVYGGDRLNVPGPVLMIPNHVSWLDWLLIGVCLENDWRFVTSSATAETSWLHRWVMRNHRTFPVDTGSPYAVKEIAGYLKGGGRLILFAEGRISRTGSLMKLFEGTGFLLLKTEAKVITCYLKGADRLRWTRHRGWKRWFPEVSVHFSELIEPPRDCVSTTQGRESLTDWVRDRMLEHRFRVEFEHGPANVLAALVNNRRLRPGYPVMEDVTRTVLSYRKLLAGIEILARQWPELIAAGRGQAVGVLLPNTNATPVAVAGLWAAGFRPAMLNFSTGPTVMLTCCRVAGIRTIITSRVFLERAELDIEPLEKDGIKPIYLEEVRDRVSSGQRLAVLLKQIIVRPFRDFRPDRNDTAIILFTSGSEGVPKGVELTHANLMANIQQMLAAVDIVDTDRLFNALPMFHSFGLTIGTFFPLVRGIYVFLYPSPLHYRVVPTVVYDRQCTIMLATNTFLNGYARKADAYDFESVRYLFAGAEKVQRATFDNWARKYGVRILEGYGVTECSPCVCVNTRISAKFGSAGRLLPAIDYRLEPVEGVDRGGRLQIRGPNVMKGYLNPEANREFQALGGWHDTGDIADVDSEGFVHILGRLKRFAKISGEMISLTAIEESLAGQFKQHGLRTEVAILTKPDEQKGERLIAVVNHRAITLGAVRKVLKTAGHSNLSMPRELRFVKEIPKLGTGKVAHRLLQQQLEKRK